jgi:hypothetical protein
MLKMTRELFMITGDKKYADFYENTFINAILSSQNPDTGMTMYFQPMATGYFKVYSKPFEHFWCCTGTGMENFTKLNDSIYFHDENRLYVNMYFSSRLDWEEMGVRITQNADIPNTDKVCFIIDTQDETEFTLCLRIPDWSKRTKIKLNGEGCSFSEEKGYILVRHAWKDQDIVEISFDIMVMQSSLPDNPNVAAFTYGPVVLSAGLGTEKMEESATGVMVTIPTKRVDVKDYLVIRDQSVDAWKRDIALNLLKTAGKLEFRLKGTDEDERLVFTPHYRQHNQRYGIYWYLFAEGSEELNSYVEKKRQAERIKAAEIDSIQPGNDQYELSHAINGQYTESGDRDGFHYRFARKNGWFSYNLAVRSDEETFLQVTYMPADCKESFSILINDTLLSHEVIGTAPWNKPVSKIYPIPGEVIGDKSFVTVKFMASAHEATARIIDVLRTFTKV